jgi:hypothetical protein
MTADDVAETRREMRSLGQQSVARILDALPPERRQGVVERIIRATTQRPEGTHCRMDKPPHVQAFEDAASKRREALRALSAGDAMPEMNIELGAIEAFHEALPDDGLE